MTPRSALSASLLYLAATSLSIPTASQAADDGLLLFASSFAGGDQAGIHTLRLDVQSGALSELAATREIQRPFFLAVSPDKTRLFAVHADKFGPPDEELVVAFAIDGPTKALRRLGAQSARGTATCYLDVDSSGRSVLAANYVTGNVLCLPVSEDGALGEAESVHQHSGQGKDPKRQAGPNAHCIIASPDNRHALAADLGIDQIRVYHLDARHARLTPHDSQPSVKLAPGSGPRHLAFHPNGRHLYCINELANTVTVFDYDTTDARLTQRQTLSTVPADFADKTYTADVKLTPDGRFLYGTNRGHDSIAAYRVAADGQLALIGITPAGGKGPQNLLVTPDNRWLLCANMPGDSISVFSIEAGTGALKATGAGFTLPKPSCLRWAE